MRTIDLAYVERGVHEELVAYVAELGVAPVAADLIYAPSA